MTDKIKKQYNDAEKVEVPAPLPLRREVVPPQPFPMDALGKVLGGAAKAIVDKVASPDAIAAQSVLAAAALATQAHADIVHPATNDRRPLSLFMMTIAASGERKSAADRFALEPIRQREAELHERHEREQRLFNDARDAYQRARDEILRKCKGNHVEAQRQLTGLGAVPQPPLTPILTAPDPTLEGLHKLMSVGEPSMGLFSDEGGAFIGGYGMSDDSRLRTGAGLSSFWDGTPVKRVRGGDGVSILRGRRLSMHIMAQPGISEALLADPTLQNQGLPSRLLVSAPASLVGTRMQRAPKAGTDAALKKYQRVMLDLLHKPQKRAGPGNPELDPIPIQLSSGARKNWVAFTDDCERKLGAGQAFEPIRAFANKLPEHALRIAGVLALVDNANATEIDASTFDRAAVLARYYAGEALRLFEHGVASVEILRAEKVLRWLHERGKKVIGLKEIYQLGPNSIREARLAREAMQVLEQHGCVVSIGGGAKIDGKQHREAWEIIQG